MSKKLIYLVSFVLLLGLALTSRANAADPNLVGWWKLNETSGNTVVNSSAHGSVLDGTRRWAPTWDSNGKINGCLNFNGRGQWVKDVGGSPPSTLLDIQEQITIAFWFKGRRNPENPGTWEAFIAKGDGAYRISRSQSGSTLHFGVNGTDLQWFDGNTDVNDTGEPEPEWHHACGTYDGSRAALYIDNVLDNALPCTGNINVNTDKLFFGANPTESSRLIQGHMDNIRLYNRAVKQTELVYVMEEWCPYAYDPTPIDGPAVNTTTVTLGWRPGDDAVSHKVYLDQDRQNVIARSGCQINGVSTTDPYYPMLDPLAMDTTYYWIVDEVSGADTWEGVGGNPNTVWMFHVPGYKAYYPNPANDANLVYPPDDVNQTFASLDVILSWKPGLGATQHDVYFGTVSPPPLMSSQQDANTYDPLGELNYGTTYYWRIDQFDGTSTTEGDEWNFTTIPADLGLKGEYYNNTELKDPMVLTRKDLNINFDWGSKSPAPDVVNADSFSVRWTGELEVPDTDTYTFSIYALGEDGIRLWVDDIPLIDSWESFDPSASENRPSIDLIKGRVSIRLEFRETAWGASCKLFWKTPSMIEREIIPVGKFYQLLKAWSPNPANRATDVRRDPILSWRKGEGAAVHDVYFSTDKTKVTDADRTNPLDVLVSEGQDPCSYEPGILEFNTTYYWRIDEVNLANVTPIWIGSIWSFTTGNFLVVDDFEKYDANCIRLYYTWRDGLDFSAYPDCGVGAYAGNGTGAIVGGIEYPWVEREAENVHNGSQSMPITYDNTKLPYYSEAYADTNILDCGTNWTLEGVKDLGLWFQGYPDYRGSWNEVGGTHTIIAGGDDIFLMKDEFRYVYKQGDRNFNLWSIEACVNSVEDTNDWAKAGVMIRNTLKPNSINAAVVVTPANGVSFQYREETGGNSTSTNIMEITAPHWVRLTLEREPGYDIISAYHANDVAGAPDMWTQIGTEVLWDDPLYRFKEGYIGLCVTSNSPGELCRGVINKVKTTGASGDWTSQEIGIPYNAPEPMYVILQDSDSSGIVYYTDANDNIDANVTQTENWMEWRIDLNDFHVQGVNLNNVRRMYIGFGDRANTQPNGTGTMHIDDIRLHPARVEE